MADVRGQTYPGPEHTVYMAEDELKKFAKMVGWKKSGTKAKPKAQKKQPAAV